MEDPRTEYDIIGTYNKIFIPFLTSPTVSKPNWTDFILCSGGMISLFIRVGGDYHVLAVKNFYQGHWNDSTGFELFAV